MPLSKHIQDRKHQAFEEGSVNVTKYSLFIYYFFCKKCLKTINEQLNPNQPKKRLNFVQDIHQLITSITLTISRKINTITL